MMKPALTAGTPGDGAPDVPGVQTLAVYGPDTGALDSARWA